MTRARLAALAMAALAAFGCASMAVTDQAIVDRTAFALGTAARGYSGSSVK